MGAGLGVDPVELASEAASVLPALAGANAPALVSVLGVTATVAATNFLRVVGLDHDETPFLALTALSLGLEILYKIAGRVGTDVALNLALALGFVPARLGAFPKVAVVGVKARSLPADVHGAAAVAAPGARFGGKGSGTGSRLGRSAILLSILSRLPRPAGLLFHGFSGVGSLRL